jgi:hypothetical protein
VPDVAELIVPGVEKFGVQVMPLTDGFCQAVVSHRGGDQMHVICHQAVSMDYQAVSFALFQHDDEVGFPIGIIEEYFVAAIASLGDMVGDVGDYNSS